MELSRYYLNQQFLKLKAYFHKYDPSNFSLLYALKACVGLGICLLLSHFIIDTRYIIFSVLSCVFIFYMNNFNSVGIKKILYLAAFTFFGCLFALIVPFLIKLGFFIAIPAFIWIFLVIFSGAISQDALKIGIYVTLLLMAMLITASLNNFDSKEVFYATLVGSCVATIFRTFAFYTYGGFTRRSFIMLLNDLIYISENITNDKYEVWQNLFVTRINEFKRLFESKSVNIKDSSLIRHQEMAMFYLLKCEEIGLALVSLRTFFKQNSTNTHIKNIQNEIIYNLEELKKIFKDEKVNLKSFYLDRLKQLNTLPILCTLVEVLYYKLELFKQGGAKQLVLKPKDKKITFDTIKEKFNLDNKYFKFSIKVALATSFSLFLAIFFKIDHGIWIAMGVFTLFKETINSTTINNKETIYAALIGFALGLLIIFFIHSKLLFLILFLSYFACIYFKHFPYFIATIFIMLNLAILFASLGLDYERLLAYRLLDFLIAFVIVYFFSLLWPSKSEDDIKPTLKIAILNLMNFLTSIIKKEDYLTCENQILLNIKSLKNILYESRTKHNKVEHIRLLESVLEMNNLCISLNDYIYSKHNKVQLKEQSDIMILITRFKMMDNISNDLPYYFYDEVEDKILSNDERIRYFINQISKRQDVVYKYLINNQN
ncbi:FUSC family protein [Campylobacter sp. Cr9]|uniref:FUSC family protein n=1 Tax=unclassified Campylobacter TaxID=2593542 RepID=UPI001EFA4E79|nr:FUSC family protein [Campylobacter sp. RM5004]MBZ7985996.1 FUSC family protein [Campylobacter sp. Cr9]ULO01269.1 FUSC family protein [Campylobacter sp. RM5004]